MRDAVAEEREWLEEHASLGMSSFLIEDPATQKTFASVVFSSCAINMDSVREILLINRGHCKKPVLYIEIPIEVWNKKDLCENLESCLNWQPDTDNLVNPKILSLGEVCYNPPALICYGQAHNLDTTPVFRPCPPEDASHILVKITWYPLDLSDNACHYEEVAGRLDPDYLQTTQQEFKADIYRRVVSCYFPQGADYWIFTLPEKESPQNLSISEQDIPV